MKNLKRRTFLKSAALATSAVLLPHCSKTESRPNIVLILLDDLGWSDLGCHGNDIVETPTIDKLASESVQFSQFYVNPVCAPTRASLLTGRHFLRTGVSHVHGGKDFVHLDETLLPEHFQNAGYATGMWGKWHSGHTDGYYPWQRGFDEAYMAQLYKHENSRGQLNGEPVEHSAWADEVITEYAIEFMRRHQHQPFFAFLPYLTCHSPLVAPQSMIDKYREKGLSENLATLYAMINFCDFHLNRLFQAMQDLGLAKNTMVLFLSDNGPAISNNLLTDQDRDIRYANNLKGHKGNIWENGVKSPLFVRWPGTFKPSTIDHLADVTDLFPTLLEIAGIALPDSNLPLDGRSLLPLLQGQKTRSSEKRSFNYANPGWPPTDQPWSPQGTKDEYRPIPPEAKARIQYEDQIISVRKGDYKLLFNPGAVEDQVELVNGYALFNIVADPREEQNLVQAKPERFQELKAELQQWFESIKQAPPSFAMPTFLIGQNGRVHNTILAKGPRDISPGLKNTFNQLWNWQQGDWAEYRIRVLTPGNYEVELHHDSDVASGALVRAHVGDQHVSGRIWDNQTVSLGALPLQTGDALFRLEIIQAEAQAIDNLVSIQLHRR